MEGGHMKPVEVRLLLWLKSRWKVGEWRLQGPLGIQGTQFGYCCLKCFKKMYVIKICNPSEIFSLLKLFWLFS